MGWDRLQLPEDFGDSLEICFVGGGNDIEVVGRYLGPVHDEDGGAGEDPADVVCSEAIDQEIRLQRGTALRVKARRALLGSQVGHRALVPFRPVRISFHSPRLARVLRHRSSRILASRPSNAPLLPELDMCNFWLEEIQPSHIRQGRPPVCSILDLTGERHALGWIGPLCRGRGGQADPRLVLLLLESPARLMGFLQI